VPHATADLSTPQSPLAILPRRSIRLREIHHLSQFQAAAKLGIARSTISRIELGKFANLSWRVLGKFCLVFEVTPDYLLGFEHALVVGFCLKCGGPVGEDPHSVRECIMSMEGQGRRFAYIAKEFDLTVKSVEFIVCEEYRIRGNRASLTSARIAKLLNAAGA
jgi:DNA-binding XRE family transcriptional regulator